MTVRDGGSQETGSTLDPYITAILIGVVRFVGCTGVSLVMTRCGRRSLMGISSIGQCISMLVSGYATMLILGGEYSSTLYTPRASILFAQETFNAKYMVQPWWLK